MTINTHINPGLLMSLFNGDGLLHLGSWFDILFFFFLLSLLGVLYLFLRRKQINEKLESLNKELIHVKEELNKKVNDLDSEISHKERLQAALDNAVKDLNLSQKIRNTFLMNMGHELWTPLNGIIHSTNLLTEENNQFTKEETAEFMEAIRKSGRRLNRLFNNVSDLNKIEDKNYRLNNTAFNVNLLIEKIIRPDLIEYYRKDLKLKLDLNPVPDINTDSETLGKVLSNVYENAVKFTQEGYIEVISAYDPINNQVFIKIKDTGVGIESSFIPHAFDLFSQEDMSLSRSYQGAGIGLAVSKKLMSILKGNISIKSHTSTGTTVTITIPAYPSSNGRQQNEYKRRRNIIASGNKKTVPF